MEISKLILEHNPFAIKIKGELKYFETYEACYDYVFRYITVNCTRGFIDVMLLISDLTGSNLKDARLIFQKMKKTVQSEYLYLDFRCFTPGTEEEIERLFKGLHTISETKLNEEMFYRSLNRFMEFILLK